jgi:hypothetical protein
MRYGVVIFVGRQRLGLFGVYRNCIPHTSYFMKEIPTTGVYN